MRLVISSYLSGEKGWYDGGPRKTTCYFLLTLIGSMAIIKTMKRRDFFLLVGLLLVLSLIFTTCSQDFYADIPCITNADCPKGYHCEADETGSQFCVKGTTEQTEGITILPEEIKFGDVQVRDRKTAEISITNKSPSRAKFDFAIEFANKTDELALEKKTISVNYNETVKVKVTYSPKKVGPLAQNQINIFLVAGGRSSRVTNVLLYGRGIDPTIVATPDNLDFGSLYPGNKSEFKSILLSNSTGGELKITNIYILKTSDGDIGGSEISEFEVSDLPSFPQDLSEKDSSIQISVRFRPKTAGNKSATLIVENTDIDNPRLPVSLQGKGETCPSDYYDVNGRPEDGCEYYCNPKLEGIDVCDGEDNDCDGEVDNGPPGELCFLKDKEKKHVVSTACIEKSGEKVCIIAECEPNYWDNDGLYDNGCEAECVRSGSEICDGIDNDCNGKTDELSPSVMCPATLNTKEAFCNKGKCSYSCIPKYGNCNDTWEDGCETKLQDNFDHCGECNRPCTLPHAIGKCEDILCKIVSCQSNYYDINKDPSDGCEYQCTPTGGESCDGKDNDCNGKTDDGDIRILCPVDIHTSFECANGACRIVSCQSGWYDINGLISDGCECQAQDSLRGNDACNNAYDLGNFSNATQSLSIETNILPVGRSAWYKARFVDDVNGDISQGRDLFHINIKLESNPQNQYKLDIYEESCSTSPNWNTFLDCPQADYHFATDFRGGSGRDGKPLGENPCYGSGNVPNKNKCKDNTMPVYFRVYRNPQATPTCDKAIVRINFTR